jgi:hypothetical protein
MQFVLTMEISRDCSSPFDGWERYPANLSSLFPIDDMEYYRRRLANATDRLFSSNACDVRIATVLRDTTSGGPKLWDDRVTDEPALEKILMRHLQARGEHFIYLTQPYTWAPFKLTDSAFRKLLTAVKVPPSFLDVVQSFGHPKTGHEKDFFRDYDYWFNSATEQIGDSDKLTFGT